MARVLSVDLGATSVRVADVDLAACPPTIEVVHRRSHRPSADVAGDGLLRWDWEGIVGSVEEGLAKALQRGPVASIGVDAWGVDYGLLDDGGDLIAPPVSYRDPRTAGWSEVAAALGAERLYATTGIQLMSFNTIFQLAAHDRRELDRASALVMLPELMVRALTGRTWGERTSASTSGLLDARTGRWADELVATVGADPAILPPIHAAGVAAGTWRGVPVHLVGGHDTASAVVAMPAPRPGAVFVSTGTWILVGAERAVPDLSARARDANFSNEAGTFGGFRFLKNVPGLWLLEQCLLRWGDQTLAELLAGAAALEPDPRVFDANDERFVAPDDMEAEVREAAGLPSSAGRDRVVQVIVESLAAATIAVVDELAALLPDPVTELHLLGGGTRNTLLVERIRARTELPVLVGPAEATALGNALSQGVAIGRYDNLAEARAALSGASPGDVQT